MLRKHKVTLTIFLVVMAFVVILPRAFAQVFLPGTNQATKGATTRETVRNTVSNMGTESALTVNERLQKRLEGQKLKLCQQKAKVIKTRSQNIVRHAIRQIEVFDKIASRTATFYTDKVVPRGKTLDNYDELIADIKAKRDEIGPLLNQAKMNAENFNCQNEAPLLQMKQFKEEVSLIIGAMHQYKKSVGDFIISVKSLVVEATPSPTVTVMP